MCMFDFGARPILFAFRSRNCDPNNPNVWCSLGVLYYQLHQNRDALDAYTRAIKLDPNLCEVRCVFPSRRRLFFFFFLSTFSRYFSLLFQLRVRVAVLAGILLFSSMLRIILPNCCCVWCGAVNDDCVLFVLCYLCEALLRAPFPIDPYVLCWMILKTGSTTVSSDVLF